MGNTFAASTNGGVVVNVDGADKSAVATGAGVTAVAISGNNIAEGTLGSELVLAVDSSTGAPFKAALPNGVAYLTGATWSLWYTDGSGQMTQLAMGSEGQVLTSHGSAAAPTWEYPA